MNPRLTDPEHWQVDACLEQIEHEELRQKEALRKFWERERRPVVYEPKLRHLLIAGALVLLAGWWVFQRIAESISR